MKRAFLLRQQRAVDRRDKQAGMALISVLLLIALLQLLATATADRLVLTLRTTKNMRDRVQAVHAADAGWVLCIKKLEQGSAPYRVWTEQAEPAYWRAPNAFEGNGHAAFNLTASWPHAARPPQCLIEQWVMAEQPDLFVYLITVRGFGSSLNAQAWVQSISLLKHAVWRHTWRAVAERPSATQFQLTKRS